MQIRPSSALRNEYTQISELAKASGEPIFITNKGEDDGVYMSMAAYEERKKCSDTATKFMLRNSAD